MDTMTWIDFKGQFMRYFCPPATRDAFRWQLLYIRRGDRSVEDYSREFLRLLYHAADMREDESGAVDLFVTGLGPIYVGIHTESHTL